MTKSALWIIMFLHLFLHVLGQLPAPQNVNLTSENFRYIVTWEPGARSPPNTRYTVKAGTLRSTKVEFTPVKKCINITTLSCDLSQSFNDPFDIYWVQVESVTNTSKSTWVESNELQPIRDNILGPPIINVSSNKQTIDVSLDMPSTPHKRKDNGKLKTVKDIDRTLIYVVTLLDKDGKQLAHHKITPESGKGYYHFENLKPKFIYCVVAKLESTSGHPSKDSPKICRNTSPENTDILWIALLIAVAVFIAIVIIICFVVLMLKFTCLPLARSQLPKSLVIIYEDLHVNLHCQELNEKPEGDHISFITQLNCSDDYQQKCQSTDLATKPLTSLNMDESIFYQSNGLSSDGYESNSLMKETDFYTYRDVRVLPSYLQTSTENRGSSSSTQQSNPGEPISHQLQYQQFSSIKDTEETRSSNVTESVLTLQTVHPDFSTRQEIKTEPLEIEHWKCPDIPLSSVKLFFNVDTEKDNSEVGTCGDGTSELRSTGDLSSQFTCDLTAATDQICIQGYQAQSLKLPQFLNDYKVQNLGKKPSFNISELECTQFLEYEAH